MSLSSDGALSSRLLCLQCTEHVTSKPSWSRWHHRLHHALIKEPTLLPQGSRLLLAISGGQDSMALLGLLVDLKRIHQWEIHLWHGNHNWQNNSHLVSNQLHKWCADLDFSLQIDSADTKYKHSENVARTWRYSQLEQAANRLNANVVTGHTGSDQAETVILQLARGSDLSGLAGMRRARPLNRKNETGAKLIRPMLIFSRKETFEICKELELPTWIDPSNQSPLYARNRIRHEVLPILSDLYPGCTMRLANLAKRTANRTDVQTELVGEVLKKLAIEGGLDRKALASLSRATRQMILHQWMKKEEVSPPNAAMLEQLSDRLKRGDSSGCCNIGKGCSVVWKNHIVFLSHTKAESQASTE